MASKPEFVQLEPADDAASVRDRLSFIRGERVLLIWPEEGTVLTRKLDLVLIQREAMRRAIKLALVTHDPLVIQHAGELNISTFETIGASERARWKRGRSKVFTSRFQRPETEPEPDELMPAASRVRAVESPAASRRRSTARTVSLLLLILTSVVAGSVLLPSATITLTLAREVALVDAPIVADIAVSDIDVENGIIPAVVFRVEIEEVGTIPTTGVEDSAAVTASGSVVFINQTADLVLIPAGTNISTSAGVPIQFRTALDATLPAQVGSQIEVPVEALPGSAGEGGNVDVGLINTVIGPLTDRVSVRNLAPTVGGQTRAVNVVSEDDRDRLLATVRQQLQSRAYTEMLPRIDANQMIVIETLRIVEERSDWTTFSAQPGDIADTLSLTMRAVVEATTIDELPAQQVAFTQLEVGPGRGVTSVNYERGPITVESSGRISFSMRVTAQIAGQVDAENLRQQIVGQTENDALAYMLNTVDLAPGTVPQLELSVPWLGRLPFLPIRINVVLLEPGQ